MEKKFVSIEDTNPRIFKNNLLEALSKTHWTIPLYVFIPIIAVLFYVSIAILKVDWLMILIFGIIGLVVWTFVEYYLHRFVFHYHPKSDFGKRIIFLFHGVHHDYPNDTKRLVMPPSASIPLALIHFIIFYLIFDFLIGINYLYPFFATFLLGYLFYDITHYALHHFSLKGKFWLYIKKHHLRHHFQHPDRGFGVSQTAWDYVFRTMFPSLKK